MLLKIYKKVKNIECVTNKIVIMKLHQTNESIHECMLCLSRENGSMELLAVGAHYRC